MVPLSSTTDPTVTDSTKTSAVSESIVRARADVLITEGKFYITKHTRIMVRYLPPRNRIQY
jgi:hypothetical protein